MNEVFDFALRLLSRRLGHDDRLYYQARDVWHYARWAVWGSARKEERPRRDARAHSRFIPPRFKRFSSRGRSANSEKIEFCRHDEPRVSIIISARGDGRNLWECLYSVKSAADPMIPMEVIVVDDSRGKAGIEAFAHGSGLRLVTTLGTQSVLHSWNAAAAEARAPYLVFLSGTAIVFHGWLKSMFEILRNNPRVGAVGPLILNEDGSVREPGRVVGDDMLPGRIGDVDYPDAPEYTRPWRVDYCSKDCILTRRDIFLALGKFSDDLLGDNWFDLDYGLKLRVQGYSFCMMPTARVMRRGGLRRSRAINGAGDRKDYRKILKKWKPRRDQLLQYSPEFVIRDFGGLEGCDRQPGSFAIHVHLYYMELAEEFYRYFCNMPYAFDLYISVISEEHGHQSLRIFRSLPNVKKLIVRVVPNRGKDIAPFVCTFAKELLDHDYLAHVHSKKSSHSSSLREWRKYLLDGLFQDANHIRKIFELFGTHPAIGMFYPQAFPGLPSQWNTWGNNRVYGERLCRQLGIEEIPEGYLEFPVGSMFWGRTKALAPLLRLGLEYEEFDRDNTKSSGTLAHAIEKVFGIVVRKAGYEPAICPTKTR